MKRPTPVTTLGNAIYEAASALRSIPIDDLDGRVLTNSIFSCIAKAIDSTADAYEIYTREVQIASIALSESGGFMLATDTLGRLWIGQRGDTVEWRRINNPQEPKKDPL